MNYFIFILKSALEDFRRNKIRTFLTSLGILIGVASVVLLISLGLGFKKYIQNQFEGLGTNLVIILPGKVFQNGKFRQGGGAVASVKFEEKDVTALKRIKEAEYVVPAFVKTVTARGSGTTEIADLYISSPDIFPTRNLETDYGRLYDKNDFDKRSKVVVIGPEIAKKLFGNAENALGKSISIDKQNFVVIGVLKSKGGGGFGGPDFDSFIYVPYRSAISFNPDKKFIGIYLKAQDNASIPQVKKEAKEILLRRLKEDDFSIAEQTEILNAVSSIFGILNIVLVSIAGISLVVGGIGIMNIMYVTVTERIKEIGVRRAVGATQRDILYQFLTESVILSLVGGILGLTVSAIVVLLIQKFFPAYISLSSVVIAVGVSSSIGVLFGVFPARKAARLSPITAIRYE